MRLDHLLSKESGKIHKLVLSVLVQGKERASIVFNFEGPVETGTSTSKYGIYTETGNRGGIAQLGEHLLCKQGVKSSSLFISTIWAHSSGG